MLFNSFAYLIFLPLVCILYYLLPHRFRWMWLLAVSCYFYMVFVPIYILILAFTIIIDYFAGILIENAHAKRRKLFLAASLVVNIGVLAVFKYFNFINENLTVLLTSVGLTNSIPYLGILLPIGLSFHTFQAMSYTIEVYRGHQKAERHLGIYALYVMFFPQLVAGPIERPQNMLHQFYEKHLFRYTNIIEGCKSILWGLFMKVAVADRLSIYVDAAYSNAGAHTGSTLLVASLFFAIQIYCDFAGYSQMAIGSARVLGFNLMQNFRRPYFAQSPSSFWKRWHISLSTWFLDYLYIPLGGSKGSLQRTCFNLLIVFLISGLWHGASWTYVIWGGLCGSYIVIERLLAPVRNKISPAIRTSLFYKGAGMAVTFILIGISWVFFRSANVDQAFLILKKIFTEPGIVYRPSSSQMIYSTAGIAILLLHDAAEESSRSNLPLFNNRYFLVRHVSYVVMVLLIMLAGVFDSGQFIYFQF